MELLEGDNKYYCDHCKEKQVATRQLKVKELPPLLCLSLQRFVFDFVKLDRVKVNDKFSFPLTLPASIVMPKEAGGVPTDDAMYDLEAILLHKGTSARHGHYGMIVPSIIFFVSVFTVGYD